MTKTTIITMFSAALIALSSCGHDHAEEKTAVDGTKRAAQKAEAISEQNRTYVIKQSDSKVSWTGTMLGVYSHEGTLDVLDGTLIVQNGEVVKGKFTVDMKSMKATDENYKPAEGKTKEQLIGHLSSPDFFDVANHPTASLTMKGNQGTLKIRGKEGPVTINDIVLKEVGNELHAIGKLVFDRSKFGATYKSAGEMVLSNEVELAIDITLKQS